MEKFLSKNIGFLLLALASVIFMYNTFSDIWLPELPEFYSSGLATNSDETIKPFEIKISKSVIKDLRSRLEIEIKRMDKNELKDLTSYWLKDYDWKGGREKLMNKYPHYKTKISGFEIHFQQIRIKKNADVAAEEFRNKTRPLLLLHGEHSSFTEFEKMIPFLLNPKDSEIDFELIIPSLPGFGYSEGLQQNVRMGEIEMAQIFLKLMKRIGHDKFYIHGAPGLGSTVASHMTAAYPHNVVGVHLSSCSTTHPLAFVRHLVANLVQMAMSLDFQYFHRLQQFYFSVPENHSMANFNSPTALAVYLYERNGNSVRKTDFDNFLDNAMIFWLTNNLSKPAVVRNDAEANKFRDYNMERVPIFTPTSCVLLELTDGKSLAQSRQVLSDKYRQIIHFTEMDQKANNPAIQIPEILAKDITAAFNLLEKRGFAFFERYHSCQIMPYKS